MNINKCLKFEDLGTGCSAYFLGIEGGGVLSLYGQDYYEFDPIDDEDYDELDETNGIRVFPKTVIRLRYHKKSGELLEHTAEGKPIAPVEYEEPDYKMLYKLDRIRSIFMAKIWAKIVYYDHI